MIRPASDSDDCRSSASEADPRRRNCPGAPTAPSALVDLAPEHPKELRHALDLVQNHQPPGVQIKVPPRIREPGRIAGILQVEVDAVRCLRGDLAGQRGLADLARTEEYHGGCLLQVLHDAWLASPLKHPR